MHRRSLLVAAAGSAAVFVTVATWFAIAGALPGDARAVRAAADTFGTSLDDPMRVLAYTGSAWVLAPIAALVGIWLVVSQRFAAAVVLAGAALDAWVLNPLLKHVFGRDRPTVRSYVEPVSRYSFPSGHATASMAFAAVAVVLAWPTRWRRPVTIGAAIYVVLVGLTRIVLGVHYPSDLLAGWALGLAVVTGVAGWALAGGAARRPARQTDPHEHRDDRPVA